MASKFLNDFKKTYPDFKDIPDEELAKGIYNNYYKADGVKEEDFYSTIELKSPLQNFQEKSLDSYKTTTPKDWGDKIEKDLIDTTIQKKELEDKLKAIKELLETEYTKEQIIEIISR